MENENAAWEKTEKRSALGSVCEFSKNFNLGENGRVSLSVSKGVITNGNLLSIYLKSKVLCTVLRDTSSSVIVMIIINIYIISLAINKQGNGEVIFSHFSHAMVSLYMLTLALAHRRTSIVEVIQLAWR